MAARPAGERRRESDGAGVEGREREKEGRKAQEESWLAVLSW